MYLGLALLAAGCSGSDEADLPAVFPATGSVLVNGSPRAGISLAFTPQPDTAGNGGYGVTDEQGKFSLTSSDGREGIPPGDYRVLLTQLTLPDGSPIPDGASAADVGAVNQLPDIYSDPERSPVTASVSETQSAPIAIEVRDQ